MDPDVLRDRDTTDYTDRTDGRKDGLGVQIIASVLICVNLWLKKNPLQPGKASQTLCTRDGIRG